MMEGSFTLVFNKLEEASKEMSDNEEGRVEIQDIQVESEEIAELRRIVLETTEPQSIYYAGT